LVGSLKNVEYYDPAGVNLQMSACIRAGCQQQLAAHSWLAGWLRRLLRQGHTHPRFVPTVQKRRGNKEAMAAKQVPGVLLLMVMMIVMMTTMRRRRRLRYLRPQFAVPGTLYSYNQHTAFPFGN
jgi:hypothetical protein